jgi:hypothetical protein
MDKLIMEVYNSKAIRLACKRLAGSDWKDLLHDVVIKLSTKDLEAIHAKGHILSYAMRTAINCQAEKHRKQKPEQLTGNEERPDEIDPYCLKDYEGTIELFLQGNRRDRILAETVKLILKHGSINKVSELTTVPARTLRHYIDEFRTKAKQVNTGDF